MKKICLAFVLLLSATHAWAQADVGPDPTKVRIRMGPLWLNPSIAVTNLGVDNNVFNEETDPKKDFTFTVSPRTEIWLRGGRTWVHGTIVEDLIWYQTYETERAGNGSYSANWLVPLNRLMLDVGGLRLNARQRADVEIDARVHRHGNKLQRVRLRPRYSPRPLLESTSLSSTRPSLMTPCSGKSVSARSSRER